MAGSAATINGGLPRARAVIAGQRQRWRLRPESARASGAARSLDDWQDSASGFVEAKLVAHCGGPCSGASSRSHRRRERLNGGGGVRSDDRRGRLAVYDVARTTIGLVSRGRASAPGATSAPEGRAGPVAALRVGSPLGVERSILAGCGVPVSLVIPPPSAEAREGWRRILHGTLGLVAALVRAGGRAGFGCRVWWRNGGPSVLA